MKEGLGLRSAVLALAFFAAGCGSEEDALVGTQWRVSPGTAEWRLGQNSRNAAAEMMAEGSSWWLTFYVDGNYHEVQTFRRADGSIGRNQIADCHWSIASHEDDDYEIEVDCDGSPGPRLSISGETMQYQMDYRFLNGVEVPEESRLHARATFQRQPD